MGVLIDVFMGVLIDVLLGTLIPLLIFIDQGLNNRMLEEKLASSKGMEMALQPLGGRALAVKFHGRTTIMDRRKQKQKRKR